MMDTWAKRHPERMRILQRDWKRRNRAKCSATTKRWVEKNRERNRVRHREYLRLKRIQDPAYRIAEAFRNRLRQALKRITKVSSSRELLGCSMEQFRAHLQLQFRPGMTWENYGPTWHVDHKQPCIEFDLSESEQQRKCFHFSNLQPLFAEENLRKNRYVSR